MTKENTSDNIVIDPSKREDYTEKDFWANENAEKFSEDQRNIFIAYGDWCVTTEEWVIGLAAVAKMLGVERKDLVKKCEDGEIKAYHKDPFWVVPATEVVAMI